MKRAICAEKSVIMTRRDDPLLGRSKCKIWRRETRGELMKFLRNPDGYPSLPQSSTSAQTKLYLSGSEGRALLEVGCRIGEERGTAG